LDPIDVLLKVILPAGRTTRSGWEKRLIKGRLESVLEHGALLGLLAFYVNTTQTRGLSNEELFGQALVHDLHEGETTDTNPSQVFLKGSKTRRQIREFWENAKSWIGDWLSREKSSQDFDRRVMRKLTENTDRKARTVFRRWWDNYHRRRNPEAELLRQLHPIADGVRGLDYLRDPKNKAMGSIDSFLEEARLVVSDPGLQPLLKRLEELKLAELSTLQGN